MEGTMKNSSRSMLCAVALAAAFTGCGSDENAQEGAADIPEGATFCDVYNDQYNPILSSPTAFGEDGFEAESEELVRIARALQELSPPELADSAAANVGYHEAARDVESVAAFVDGNLEVYMYALDNC